MSKHTPGPWVWVGRYLVPASAAGEDYPALFAVADDGSAYGEYTETLVPGSPDGRLIAQAPTMLADLIDAAAQLRKYETLHRAKGTPDSLEKAEVNAALAARFEATIAAAVGGAE